MVSNCKKGIISQFEGPYSPLTVKFLRLTLYSSVMFSYYKSGGHPGHPHNHGQDGEDPDRPGLLSVLPAPSLHGGEAGDGHEQEEGVGQGEDVCNGGGVDAGVGGADC